MKRGELMNKGIAAALTLMFLAVVRPDPAPSGISWGIASLLMYEGVRYIVWYIRREQRREKARRNTCAMKYDGRRWADMEFQPIKIIS